MKFELDVLRPHVKALDQQPAKADYDYLRRSLREVTDETIRTALLANSRPALSRASAQTMLTVASTLLCLRLEEPQLEDFVVAARELVELARKSMDRGLQTADGAGTVTGAVMLEIAARGICACVSIPYEEAFRAEVVRFSGEEGAS